MNPLIILEQSKNSTYTTASYENVNSLEQDIKK